MTEVTAKLKRANGEILAEIPLPESAADISLMRYISFLSEMRKFHLGGINPIQIMAQAVSEVSGVDVSQVLLSKIGEQWHEDKQLDGGIRSIYGWYVNALTNYKGESRTVRNFSFQYKGSTESEPETYQIPYIVSAELAGGLPQLPEIETQDAIEAYETIRGFDQQIKDAGDPDKERGKRIFQLKKAISEGKDVNGDMVREITKLETEIDIAGDPNGNLIFAQYLRMIAILAKRPGERLPTNDGDRERWIQNRMIHFQGIDTKTALDIDFFLIRLLAHSKKTHPVIGFLIRPLFALSAATLSRPQPKGKPTIKRYRDKKKYKNALVGVR